MPVAGIDDTHLAINPEPINLMRVEIRGSIEATLTRKSPEHGAALAAQVARLLHWKGDIIRDVHPHDTLMLAFRFEDGVPRMLAFVYQGHAIQMHAFPLLDENGILRLYNEKAELIEPELLHAPIRYQQITETMQSGRGKRRHQGIDLKADVGTPIYTPFPAIVSRINWSTRLNGNCVDLVYTAGPLKRYHAFFLHLDSIAALKSGERLQDHARIGTVGNSGRSSAPHLHYELRDSRGNVQSP